MSKVFLKISSDLARRMKYVAEACINNPVQQGRYGFLGVQMTRRVGEDYSITNIVFTCEHDLTIVVLGVGDDYVVGSNHEIDEKTFYRMFNWVDPVRLNDGTSTIAEELFNAVKDRVSQQMFNL